MPAVKIRSVSPISVALLLLAAVVGAPEVGHAVCNTPGACALQFGGTNAYVTFGNTSALGLSPFTIETWFNRQGTGASTSTGTGGVTAIPLLTKGRAQADGNNQDMNYFLGIRASDNVLAADFEEGAGGTSPGLNHPVAGVTPIVNGTWYHAAATYDGTTWRLYLNGALEAQLTVGQPPRSDSIQHAGLATAMTSTGAAAGFFNGVLDEARVWNTARTQLQIQDNMLLEIASDANLVARWGMNEGTGTAVGDSSGTAQNGTITGANWDWVEGSPFAVNTAPDEPVLNAPANGAVDVLTSPTLDVSVSDPDGDLLTVNFFGREAATAAPDFTLVALPDTQYYVSSLNGGLPAMFDAQTQWIVANKNALNIAYVAQLGDCVENGDNGGNPVEWQNASTSIGFLENPITTQLLDGIPFGIAVGNHDQSPAGDAAGTTTFYNQYFGESHFLGRAYYGGHFGTNNDQHFDLFSASGMDFIVVYMEYDTVPDAAVLTWADNLLQTYSSRRAIVVSHWIVNTGNPGSFGAQGQAIYDALKDNPNLFLMLSGHVPGEGRRQDTFAGSTVDSLLSDYQARTGGGNGWLRILTFSPANNQISVQTYSPWLNSSETDADSQFTLSYDMGGAGFTTIATNTNVPSGSSTTASWPGRTANTEYEWYVTADDGTSTTEGPVWSFTTTGCGNGVVGGGEECDDGDTVGGDGCSATCTVEDCYACAGGPSICTPDNGAPCDDLLFCNGSDTCAGGTCSVHAGDPCPGPDGDGNCSESCNEAGDSCTAADPNGSACTDALFCNGTDTCSGGACTSHAGNPCTGGVECNNVCNEAANNCAVTGGTPCTDDGNVCTNDECTGTGACGHPNNTAPCTDDLFCNGTDTCGGGTCSVHAGNPCTGGSECADACDETADSCFDPSGTPCNDDLYCTVDDACQSGNCVGTPRNCNTVGEQCNDGTCDEDQDVCIGPPKPDGTPCDDAEACTAGDSCTAGQCGGTPDPEACVDHFQCYKARITPGTPRFTAIAGVHLVDQFENGQFDVKRVRHLCPPAEKNGGTVHDDVTHLQSYVIKPTIGSPSVPTVEPRTNIEVVNQFGTLRVDLFKADLLLVPTAKDLVNPPPPPTPTEHLVDHYKCYKVRVTRGTPRFPSGVTAAVEDQFTNPPKGYDIKRPKHLCVPVVKAEEPIVNPSAHLLCYIVRPTLGQPRHTPVLGLQVNNQFGPLTLDTRKEQELCLPTLKNP